MLLDLESVRRRSERVVRGYYVFDQPLEDIDGDVFRRVWHEASGRLVSKADLREPVLFIELQWTPPYWPYEAAVFLIGLGSIEPEGFFARQILIADHGGETQMLSYLAEELGRAGSLVGYGVSTRDARLLSEGFRRSGIEFDWQQLPLLSLGRECVRFLGTDGRMEQAVAAEMSVRRRGTLGRGDQSRVFMSWEKLSSKPADERELLNGQHWQSHSDLPELLAALLESNLIRLRALIQLTERVCRVASDPALRSATALLADGVLAQRRKNFDLALECFTSARDRTQDEDERYQGELRISLIYKQRRRLVEALEIWNRLADKGVIRAMRELVSFYEKVDPDPARALELCGRFLKMGIDEIDDGWMKHRQKIFEAILSGKPAPSRPKRRPRDYSWILRARGGEIDVRGSKKKGRIIRYPKRVDRPGWW